jgi:hypothetical protein
VLPTPFRALATGGASAPDVTAGQARADRGSRCRKRRRLVEVEVLAQREEEEVEDDASGAREMGDSGIVSDSPDEDGPSPNSTGRRMRGGTRCSGREPMSAAVDLAGAVATRTLNLRPAIKLNKRLVAAPSTVPIFAQVFVTSAPLLTAAERGWIMETAERVGWGSDCEQTHPHLKLRRVHCAACLSACMRRAHCGGATAGPHSAHPIPCPPPPCGAANNDREIQAGARITLGNPRMLRRGPPGALNAGLTADELALLRTGFAVYHAVADLLARAYGVTARRLPDWVPGQASANVAAWKRSVVHNMSLLRYTADHPSLGLHRDSSHFAFVLPLAHDAAGGGGTRFHSIGTVRDVDVRQPLGCLGLHCSKVAHGSVPIIPHRSAGAGCSRTVLVGFVHVEGMPRNSSPKLPMNLQGDLDALGALCGGGGST